MSDANSLTHSYDSLLQVDAARAEAARAAAAAIARVQGELDFLDLVPSGQHAAVSELYAAAVGSLAGVAAVSDRSVVSWRAGDDALYRAACTPTYAGSKHALRERAVHLEALPPSVDTAAARGWSPAERQAHGASVVELTPYVAFEGMRSQARLHYAERSALLAFDDFRAGYHVAQQADAAAPAEEFAAFIQGTPSAEMTVTARRVADEVMYAAAMNAETGVLGAGLLHWPGIGLLARLSLTQHLWPPDEEHFTALQCSTLPTRRWLVEHGDAYQAAIVERMFLDTPLYVASLDSRIAALEETALQLSAVAALPEAT